MKYRKWHGYGHVPEEPDGGGLSLFCAACPQPEINLAKDWAEQLDRYAAPSIIHPCNQCKSLNRPSGPIYTRGLVLDGNFKLAHVKQKRPADDVWLSNGHGMMTEDVRYRKHIALAVEDKEVNLLRFQQMTGSSEYRNGHVVYIVQS